MLGALDAEEQGQVQNAIDSDPRLEEQLLALKYSLSPLEVIERPVAVPTGLARRTCQIIAMAERHGINGAKTNGAGLVPRSESQGSLIVGGNGIEESSARMSSFRERLAIRRSRFSFVDFVVAITAATIIGALIFPALLLSRFDQRVTGCQSNLTTLYRALGTYAENHDGNFVSIPTYGKMSNVGSFAPVLKDSGLVPDDSVFACTGVSAANNLPPVHIPSCKQIMATDCPKQLGYYRQCMAGHYGYSMGYFRGTEYVSPCDQGRANIVLLADSPSCNMPGRASKNHGGLGQNCLMENGQILFLREPAFGEDLIYMNELNVVLPGVNDRDSVIAPSHVPMFVQVAPNR